MHNSWMVKQVLKIQFAFQQFLSEGWKKYNFKKKKKQLGNEILFAISMRINRASFGSFPCTLGHSIHF